MNRSDVILDLMLTNIVVLLYKFKPIDDERVIF